MNKELKALEEIDRSLDELVAFFILYFDKNVRRQMRRELIKFIDDLDYSDKTLKGRLVRQRAIYRYRNTLTKAIQNGTVRTGNAQLIDGYKLLVEMSNRYFSMLSVAYDKNFYRELYKDSINILKVSLGGQGFSDGVVKFVTDKLAQLNIQGVTKAQLKSDLIKYLEGKNEATRYVSQLTNDTLYTMTRIYQNRISEDLKVGYWLYAGTLIITSRNFCTSRTGRVYTTEEVKNWAALSWSGKMEGTNKENIFERLGGYGCRHTLRPISRNLYNNLRKNGNN